MPIANYAILKGVPVVGKIFPPHSNRDQPHYHIHVQAGGDFDIAVNIQSTDGSEVLYYVASDFTPPNVAGLTALPSGITRPVDASLALDYVRVKGLVTREQMTLLPIDETVAASASAMHSQIDTLVQKAIQEQATIYAFGQSFGSAGNSRNPFFGFSPDQGIHDIHMNQGNPAGSFGRDNGTYQDGGLFIAWADGTWSAVFIAFQSQSFNTDDNGNQVS